MQVQVGSPSFGNTVTGERFHARVGTAWLSALPPSAEGMVCFTAGPTQLPDTLSSCKL